MLGGVPTNSLSQMPSSRVGNTQVLNSFLRGKLVPVPYLILQMGKLRSREGK